MKRLIAILMFLSVLLGFGVGIATYALSSSQPPVVICQQFPCANGQIFQAFDGNGAPICSIGETGGFGCYGDNISITGGPGRVVPYKGGWLFWPSIVASYESPALYAQQHFNVIWAARCKVPAKWIDPNDTLICISGRWVRIGR